MSVSSLTRLCGKLVKGAGSNTRDWAIWGAFVGSVGKLALTLKDQYQCSTEEAEEVKKEILKWAQDGGVTIKKTDGETFVGFEPDVPITGQIVTKSGQKFVFNLKLVNRKIEAELQAEHGGSCETMSVPHNPRYTPAPSGPPNMTPWPSTAAPRSDWSGSFEQGASADPSVTLVNPLPSMTDGHSGFSRSRIS